MSDLCMYELQGITWDDVSQYDDHIVPLPSNEEASEHLFQDNTHKRSRQEVTCASCDTGEPFVVEPTSQEPETLSPYGARNKLQRTDSILNDMSAAVGSSLGYSLDDMSEADNNIGLFSHIREEKESNDLYSGWPDTGNFEDLDQMFRGSMFELGARDEDDLGWFPSSGSTGESENVFSYLDSNSQNAIGESHEALRLNGVGGPIGQSNIRSSSVVYECSFWPSADDDSASLGQLPASNVSSGNESNDVVLPKGQRKKQPEHQNQSANDQSAENNSFIYIDNMAELVPQQKQVSDSDTYRYLWSDTPNMSSENSTPLDHTSMHPTLSAIKSENSILNSLPTKDSYTLNKLPAKEDSRAPPFPATSIGSIEKRQKLDELKNNTEIEGEVGSSGAKETSSTNSGIDGGISREAASVHELQLVLDQLDTRTKLCIRDSLFRLAQSAEQRHKRMPADSSHGDDKYIGFLAMETATNPIDRSMAHLLYHKPCRSVALDSPMPASF